MTRDYLLTQKFGIKKNDLESRVFSRAKCTLNEEQSSFFYILCQIEII